MNKQKRSGSINLVHQKQASKPAQQDPVNEKKKSKGV